MWTLTARTRVEVCRRVCSPPKQEGVPNDPPFDVLYVGCLPVDIGVDEQEVR